ncbi:hypothetical protein ACHAXT_009670 [Thalassiosira profunda]
MPAAATDNDSGEADSLADEIAQLRTSDVDLEAESKAGDVASTGGDAPTGENAAVEENTPPHLSSNRPRTPYHFVPLRLNGRTHVPSAASAALLVEIGGLPALQAMTERFYANAFQDATLDKFLRDRNDPHGRRFATWIHQKLGGPGNAWDSDRAARSTSPVSVANGHRIVVSDRSSAHVAAWHSPKRPANEVGRHFQLDECRVWMRIHFWAVREAGLSPSFVDYYVRFIGHFVNVYERAAPAFARESYRWSGDKANIDAYIASGRTMTDVMGQSLGQALRQIPEAEAQDGVWPYGQSGDGTEGLE